MPADDDLPRLIDSSQWLLATRMRYELIARRHRRGAPAEEATSRSGSTCTDADLRAANFLIMTRTLREVTERIVRGSGAALPAAESPHEESPPD